MNKKSLIIDIVIIIIFVIFLIMFITKKNPTNGGIVVSGCLDNKISSSDIDLSKNNKQTVDITIKNKCDRDYKYYIMLSVKRDSDSDDLVNVKLNSNKKVLTKYDKNIMFNVSTGYLNSYILDNNVLKSNKSKDFKIVLSSDKTIKWISEIKVVGTSA